MKKVSIIHGEESLVDMLQRVTELLMPECKLVDLTSKTDQLFASTLSGSNLILVQLSDGRFDKVVGIAKQEGIPVIVLSGNDNGEKIAHDMGVNFLPTPFHITTFCDRASELLGIPKPQIGWGAIVTDRIFSPAGFRRGKFFNDFCYYELPKIKKVV